MCEVCCKSRQAQAQNPQHGCGQGKPGREQKGVNQVTEGDGDWKLLCIHGNEKDSVTLLIAGKSLEVYSSRLRGKL